MLELHKCMQYYNETKCNYNGLSKQTEQRQFCHQRRSRRLESTCFWTPRLRLLPITSSVYLCHHHLRCGHHPHYLAIQQHLFKDAKMDQQSVAVSRSKDSSNRSISFSSKSLPQPISQQISLQARAGAGWNWIMRKIVNFTLMANFWECLVLLLRL